MEKWMQPWFLFVKKQSVCVFSKNFKVEKKNARTTLGIVHLVRAEDFYKKLTFLCAYQVGKKCFSEDFAYVLNGFLRAIESMEVFYGISMSLPPEHRV